MIRTHLLYSRVHDLQLRSPVVNANLLRTFCSLTNPRQLSPTVRILLRRCTHPYQTHFVLQSANSYNECQACFRQNHFDDCFKILCTTTLENHYCIPDSLIFLYNPLTIRISATMTPNYSYMFRKTETHSESIQTQEFDKKQQPGQVKKQPKPGFLFFP